MLALRERRMKACQGDLFKAKEKALYKKKRNVPEGLYQETNRKGFFFRKYIFNNRKSDQENG